MYKQMLAVAGAVVLGALIAVAFMDRPAAAQAGGDGVGKIHVVGTGSAFIMYETGGNTSWVCIPQAADKKYAWFPIKRLDTDQQVQVWKIGKSE